MPPSALQLAGGANNNNATQRAAAAKIVANAIQSAKNSAAKAEVTAARAQAEANAAKAKAEANAAAAQNAEARAAAKAMANEATRKARNAAEAEKAANNARKSAEEAAAAKTAQEAKNAAAKALKNAAAATIAMTRGLAVTQQAAKPVNLTAPGVIRTNPLAESNSDNENATSLSSGNIENSIIRKLGKTNFKQVNAARARNNSRLNKSEQLYLQRIWAQKMFNEDYKQLLKVKGYAQATSMQTLLARMQGYIRLMGGVNANREPKLNSVKNIVKYTLLMGKAKSAQNPNVKRAFALANKGWQNQTAHTKNHEKLLNNLQTVYNKYYNANGKPKISEMALIRNGSVLIRKANRRQYRTTKNSPTNYSKRGNWYHSNKGKNYITPNKGITFYEVVGSRGSQYTVNMNRKLGENIL